ncbi:hypothetical protein [Massilia sp. CCM 8734]|uniref:hypothetical protein n=1 Tax=Massilia sp. CCM 8734 TaxID=2609283 RepID=UPI001420386B|nr:hypothetical protein [Massilia sp. CCM 8734]NHZ99629.1 hypothetical protein [Massilia sp. CCM 8734]
MMLENKRDYVDELFGRLFKVALQFDSRKPGRGRLTKKFLLLAGPVVFNLTGNATAGEIRSLVFQTQNSLLAPEVNIVLYNDKDYPKTFAVDFGFDEGKPRAANRQSCVLTKRGPAMNDKSLTKWEPPGIPRPYSEFERLATVAIVSAKSFVHRYYPVGLFTALPCEIDVTITDKADGKEVNSRIVISKPAQEADVEPDNVSVTSTVDSLDDDKLRLVTILVKNNAARPAAFRLVGKRLVDCNADISDSLVREGMEGSFVRIEKHSYAAILTAINMRPGPVPKDCRLSAEFQAVAPLSRHNPLRQVTVPLTAKAQYLRTSPGPAE